MLNLLNYIINFFMRNKLIEVHVIMCALLVLHSTYIFVRLKMSCNSSGFLFDIMIHHCSYHLLNSLFNVG